MNKIIKENCQIIRRFRSELNTEKLLVIFDLFRNQLTQIEEFHSKCLLIDQISSSLSNLENRYEKLSDRQLLNHELFVLLRDHLIVYLEKIFIDETLRSDSLFNLSKLFNNICHFINENNFEIIKRLILSRDLIDQISKSIDFIDSNSNLQSNVNFVRTINLLLISLKDLRRYEITRDEYELLSPILNQIIKCLCSTNVHKIIRNFETHFNNKLSEYEVLLLDTMPLYLQWYPSSHRQIDSYIEIVGNIIDEYSKWFINVSPQSFVRCSYKFGRMIRHLNTFLIRPIESNNLYLLSEKFFYEYSKLVFQWSFIFVCLIKENLIEKLAIRILIQNIYNLTLHLNVLNLIKTIPNVISMLFKLISIDDDEIQLNSYRCLGKILNQNDIKSLDNANKIVSVYIDYLRKTVDDKKSIERFSSLLESLKSISFLFVSLRLFVELFLFCLDFVQHDEVKVELLKQNVFPLLFKCLFQENIHRIEVKVLVLEVLFSLSFNDDAFVFLKEHQRFVDFIRKSSLDNENNQLQKVSEGLLWRLEKEEDLIHKCNPTKTYLYEIMISYSHRDQHICLQIYEQLVNEGYKVWIDKDCLYGQTMGGMADAIENCQFVIVCMSNTYKESVYCQSEAHYAYERGCCIIPILIQSNYKPDGWLGIIVSGKIFINFADQDFQYAFLLLKNQIDQQKQIYPEQSSLQTSINTQFDTTNNPTQQPSQLYSNDDQLPKDLTNWTNEHVKYFFRQIKLDHNFYYLCSNMTGESLLQIYEMCLLDRQSMYQTFKAELNFKYQILLPIADYILFIQRIQPFIDKQTLQRVQRHSTQFYFTFCNIL